MAWNGQRVANSKMAGRWEIPELAMEVDVARKIIFNLGICLKTIRDWTDTRHIISNSMGISIGKFNVILQTKRLYLVLWFRRYPLILGMWFKPLSCLLLYQGWIILVGKNSKTLREIGWCTMMYHDLPCTTPRNVFVSEKLTEKPTRSQIRKLC
jgi:hypothetical protein